MKTEQLQIKSTVYPKGKVMNYFEWIQHIKNQINKKTEK